MYGFFHLLPPVNLFCKFNFIIITGFCKQNYNSVYKSAGMRLSLLLRGDNTEALETERQKKWKIL